MTNFSKYDKVIISNFSLDNFFFKLHELNGNNFYLNKSRTFCFFDYKQFQQLNGFHQDSNEFIYDFGQRLEKYGYKKNILQDEHDKSNKKFVQLENNLKFWNKECEQLKVSIKKQNSIFYLI